MLLERSRASQTSVHGHCCPSASCPWALGSPPPQQGGRLVLHEVRLLTLPAAGKCARRALIKSDRSSLLGHTSFLPWLTLQQHQVPGDRLKAGFLGRHLPVEGVSERRAWHTRRGKAPDVLGGSSRKTSAGTHLPRDHHDNGRVLMTTDIGRGQPQVVHKSQLTTV